MRIGILGGSFNPPHNAHKQIALKLIKNNFLDKVIFVVTGDKYQKKDLVPANQRYEMVKMMINDNSNLEVSDYEINNNLVYTYQTLDHFKEMYPNDTIYFIRGSSDTLEMKSWKNSDYIFNNYKILVIERNDNEQKLNNDSIIYTGIELGTISSTFIRNNIEKDIIKEYLDNKVYQYIHNKKLYKNK